MSSTLLEQYRYTISDIKLKNPPIPYLTIHKRVFLIEITKVVDSDNERLKPAEGKVDRNQVVWNEQILYNVNSEFTVNFKILMKKEKGKKGKNDELNTIGECTTTMSRLLNMSSECTFHLREKCQLGFKVKEDRFKDILDKAKQQSENVYFADGKSWSTFLTYLGIVKAAIDPVASLNPCVHKIWSVVSMVPNALQANDARTKNIKELLQKLLFIYEYIDEADRLSVLRDTRTNQLKILIETTCECAEFINSYAENNPAANFIKGPIFDDKISGFQKSFDQIIEHNREFLLLDIASDIVVSNLLGDIHYANDAGFVEGKKCLPGTREMLIKEIEEWVKKDTTERVLIVSGQAGTGKSAVAHTIAKNLNDQVGSFFCFSQSNKGMVKFLFSTISRNLADRNVLWRRNLVQVVKDIAIRKSSDPETQFNEMIIKPSKGTTKRIIIIIDALDESGDQMERKVLLNLLFERSSELPNNYRIIITSRPEYDIARFHRHPNVHCMYMADVNPTDTLNDIQRVISYDLSDITETLNAIDRNWSLLLAQSAQNFFIWAKLACVYILELDSFEAADRLKSVLSKPTSSLYEMYGQILDAQPGCKTDSYLTLLKMFVKALMVSRKPLSVSDLQAFFGPICGGSENVKVILKPLNSLFIGLDQSIADAKLRPIHSSVLDFFLSSEQKPGTSNRYQIDTSDQSSLTHACLRVMNEMLRFNICGLETSHIRNRDIPNFDSRVAKAIPSSLSYACCFWAYHLEYSSLNEDLLCEINDLICTKLLYLFEVLSLLAEVDHGRSGMQILKNMTEDTDPELASRAAEASQFALKFGLMMMESTPHLYLSALPYISKESFISSQFFPQYPQLFSMDVGQPIALQPQYKNGVMQRHPSAFSTALAFSPTSRHVAAGFSNGDLWVWHYITGEIIYQKTSEMRLAAIWNMVFSLNGELIYGCFGDGSILIWEEKTKNVSYESNEGIAPKRCHHCYISPDGHFVAFMNSEAMIFYERETHVKLFEYISSHWGYSSEGMFSPSGRFFGFQFRNEALRLWDTREKTFIPFVSLTNEYQLGAFDDNFIIVNFMNFHDTYEVYDIQTRRMVHRLQTDLPLYRKARLAFSPNGEDLLLSGENMYLVCKVSTGKVSQRFVGHSRHSSIPSIALSSDARHIAFATQKNKTTHVLAWDGLDREESNLNWDEDDDDIGDEDMSDHGPGRVWHKGQHLVLGGDRSDILAGDLQVLDPAGITVLEATFVFDVEALAEIYPEDNFRSFVEVSPEDNHWSIAYVDLFSGLCLWNINEKEVFTIDESGGRLNILAFSPSGDLLISCDKKSSIDIWDVRTRTLSSRGRISSTVTALAFSQTGATFWAAYQTEKHTFIEEFGSESWETIHGPFSHDPTIRSIFVSSNNAYMGVYSNSRDPPHTHMLSGKLRILDCSTSASIDCFSTVTDKPPLVSSNGKYIAWIPFDSEDRRKVNLWDLEKGIALDGFSSDDWIMMFCFSNDSERICVLGDVGGMECISIWNIQAKNIVTQRLPTKSLFGWVWASYAMALHGDSLLLADLYGTVKVWNLRVHEIMTHFCSDHINNPQFGVNFAHLRTRRLIEDYNVRSEDTKTLDYALMAWHKATFLPWTKLDEDGWMLGPHGELLFWVPQKMREDLWYPGMSFMKCREKFTKLNFENFVHGASWIECNKPLRI